MRDADFEASQSELTQELTENMNKNKKKKATGLVFFVFAGCHVCLLILEVMLHHMLLLTSMEKQ